MRIRALSIPLIAAAVVLAVFAAPKANAEAKTGAIRVLFLGHESQLPNPGDFIVSRMGTEEVIVVRDRNDNKIRAFLNSCRHGA